MGTLSHLDELEAEAIYIMREVAAECEKPVMLYSIGKDSSVMLHLAMKAFYPEKPPFPFMHIDTTWKFKEMIEFRDKIAKEKGRFTYIPKNLFYYRIHDGATTKACLKNQEKTQEELEMFAKFWPKPVVKLLMHFYKIGYKSYDK